MDRFSSLLPADARSCRGLWYRQQTMLPLRIAALMVILLSSSSAMLQAQSASPDGNSLFSRKNTFGLFGEYSNDSSHILAGQAANRKLLSFGAAYSRRIFLWPSVDLQYLAELRPIIVESDPIIHETQTYTGPPANTTGVFSFTNTHPCPAKPFTRSGVYMSGPYQGAPYTIAGTFTCSRQWTFGNGLSPVGLKFNFLPRRRMQPVFTLAGGYMFSTQPIPVDTAGSFNYTLEFGAGVELYRSRDRSTSLFGNRSMRAEYRYHHISNAYTAHDNPGIDSGLLQITYAFGR